MESLAKLRPAFLNGGSVTAGNSSQTSDGAAISLPNGGAIAFGHPLGCTGAKLTATLLHEMTKRKLKYGMVTMCIGGGMGAAGVYELL